MEVEVGVVVELLALVALVAPAVTVEKGDR